MKKLALLLTILLFCGMVSAQTEETVKTKPAIRFSLQGSVGGIHETTYNVGGVAESLSGMIELPISKRYPGWTFSTGIRFANQNLLMNGEYIITTATEVVSHPVTVNKLLFVLEVPFLFGYDFRFADNRALRLDFGLFYQRFLCGAMNMDGKNLGVPTQDDYGMRNNIGWNSGIAFYINDFFVGLDLNVLFDWAYQDNHGAFENYNTLSAKFGYRF